MEVKRGHIHYVAGAPVVGHEQFAGRPAIVVSNDAINKFGGVVEVVYLTTQPKTELPTHVTISSTKFESTALCEQISTVSVKRLGDYYCSCTAEEMERIDRALKESLSLDVGK